MIAELPSHVLMIMMPVDMIAELPPHVLMMAQDTPLSDDELTEFLQLPKTCAYLSDDETKNMFQSQDTRLERSRSSQLFRCCRLRQRFCKRTES